MKAIFKTGIIDGLPIAVGYLAVSFSFGIAAVAAGLSPVEAIIISMTNLTSAGQFASIGIITSGGSYIEMALSQFVINLRYALMGISLSQKLDKSFTRLHALLLGHALTDEIFAVAASRSKKVRPVYFFGLAVLPYIGWSLGTAAGAVFGALLPDKLCSALSVSIYGMFIAIIVPAMKKSRAYLTVTMLAVAISCCLHYVKLFESISSGFAIIICAVIASAAGALIFPEGGEEQDE
ncbi:MAG: AzlC family ABC transporter permease [Clostridiales bacterium]|nr:AzlC family ABC transporter permease [Clostridiales bacterium]